jgi:hypothetical protein
VRFLKQSTASQVRTIGPFVDDGDFKTLENGLTIANTDILLKKNGAASAAKNSGGATADTAGGMYHLTFDATDTGTVGELFYSVKVAGALVVFGSFWVLEEAIYDALYGASAAGFNSSGLVTLAAVTHTGATIPTVTTTGTATAVTTVNGLAAGVITAASIAADAITDAKVASDVTIASVTGAVGSVTGAVGSVTGSVGSVATGGITAASFAANAITAAKLDPDVTTEIQSGLATASALSTVAGYLDTEIAAIKAVTDLLPNGGALSSLATAAALATVDGIVDDILLDTAEIGTAGAGLTNINLPNQTMDIIGNITGNLSGSVGSVTGAVGSVTGLTASDVGAIKAETDKLADTLEDDAGTYRFTTNALEQAPTGGSAPTAATIADAVWDELLSGHAVSGSTGEALSAAGTAGDPWTTALPGAYGSGTAGKIIGDNINATISSRASQTSVDDLPTNAELATSQASADDATLAAIAGLNNLSAAGVRTELATELGRIDAAVSTRATPAQVATELGTYDAPTKAELDAAVALLATAANLAAAKVVVDAIKVKTDLIPSDPAETSDIPSAATVAAAVLAAAASNPIDANVQEINDVALTGDGNTTPWGPAA